MTTAERIHDFVNFSSWGLVQPGILSVPELCHHIAEAWVSGAVLTSSVVQYKRHNPGKVRIDWMNDISLYSLCTVVPNFLLCLFCPSVSFASWPVESSPVWLWSGATFPDWCFPTLQVSLTNPDYRPRPFSQGHNGRQTQLDWVY